MEITKHITSCLFGKTIDQKTVRNVNRGIRQLTPDSKVVVVSEVKKTLGSLLTTQPLLALTTVHLVCDGCPDLYESIEQLVEEVLLTCAAQLSSQTFVAHRTQSPFRVALKALYSTLQYILPRVTERHGRPPLMSLLPRLHNELIAALASDKLPSDCGLITATALCLLTYHMKQQHMKRDFLGTLVISNKLCSFKCLRHLDTQKELIECLLEYKKYHNPWYDDSDGYDIIEPSYQVALLFHGLFNSGLEWIYFDDKERTIPWHEGEYCQGNDNIGSQTDSDSNYEPTVTVAVNDPRIKVEAENGGVFLYEVYPTVRKLCEGATSYCFQAFQVLHMWLKAVRNLGKRIKKMEANTEEVVQPSTSCYLYRCHPSQEPMFTFMSDHRNSVFHLLNSNWENPAKGVSDMVYTCMTELLSLHEDGHPGSSHLLASTMLLALVSSAAWSTKATYPPMALAVTHVGAKETVIQHPSLPSSLVLSLGVNHLAPAGTSVYKVFLAHLTLALWSPHFMTPLLAALHSQDRLTRQHALSLWLPPTLRQYPSVYPELLLGCSNTTGGWVARMAILKVVRSNSLLDLEDLVKDGDSEQLKIQEEETQRKHKLCKKSKVERDTEDRRECLSDMVSDIEVNDADQSGLRDREVHTVSSSSPMITSVCDREAHTASSSSPVIASVCVALNHIDENVRGEALALLCLTRKASHPLSAHEARCLRIFFEWNANIDSAPFRQGILKSYKALIVRIRDASAAELKRMKAVNSAGKLVIDPVKAFTLSPILEVNVGMLVWLLRFFHDNVFPDGNYQRRILAHQLYKETLLAFYTKVDTSRYTVGTRYKSLCDFINASSLYSNISENVKIEDQCDNIHDSSLCSGISESVKRENQPLIDLALPWTIEALFYSCLDEMSDVREEAEEILKILGSCSGGPSVEESGAWLRRGLALTSSPKSSDVESGASVLVVAASICYNKGYGISTLLEAEGWHVGESLVSFMLGRVEEQFRRAQDNLLLAARSTPIHGSLLALGRCLTEDQNIRLDHQALQNILERLINLMVELVEFMLSKLACASLNGSSVAPSFGEMGQSVEKIIKECGGGDNTGLESCQLEAREEEEEDLDDSNIMDSALSADHILVLACCWQTMKACCVVSGWCVTRLLGHLSMDCARSLTTGVVVRTLAATRHKGAMEAARAAYALICRALLNAEVEYGQMVYEQVEDLLVGLREGRGTSVTRRGAGAAMMVQAACGAAPRSTSALLSTTLSTLLSIAQAEVDVDANVDAAPVLSLHLLQSLVLHAPLAPHLSPHLPAITSTCLSAFTSHSWSLRNAALQLYGAVVPRMVGQKKVRDDSSALNSLTAPEFIARHPHLSRFLLAMLEDAERVVGDGKRGGENKSGEGERGGKVVIERKRVGEGERGGKGKNGGEGNCTSSNEMASIKLSSSLVPALSLVARLSPGTKIQHSSDLTNTLEQFRATTTRLLASPVHTVRRLASLAIVTLTPTSEARHYVVNVIRLVAYPGSGTASWIHGNLLMVTNFLEMYPKFTKDQELKNSVSTSLRWLCEPNINTCYINANLALKIIKLMHIDVKIDQIPTDLAVPGAAQYVQTLMKIRIESNPKDTIERILMTDAVLTYDCVDHCVDYIKNYSIHGNQSWLLKLEALLWKRFGEESTKNKIILATLQLLNIILMNSNEIKNVPPNTCMKYLLFVVQGKQGYKATSLALITVAHLLKNLRCEQWEEEIRHDIILAFTERVKVYSASTSTEEYRLAATTALRICIETLINNSSKYSGCKEQLIVSCIQLLQDEDPTIRDSASYIVSSFLSSGEIVDTDSQKEASEFGTKDTILTSDSTGVFHPNKAISEFVYSIAKTCVRFCDWSTLRVLWRICSGQIGEDSSSKTLQTLLTTSTQSYLFQSHTMNLYKEPRQLSIVIARALVAALREYSVCDSNIPEWLQEEEEVLNQHGNILSDLVCGESQLYKHKQLLTVTCVYVIACETFTTMCEVLHASLKLTHPLKWKPDSYCVIFKADGKCPQVISTNQNYYYYTIIQNLKMEVSMISTVDIYR